MRRRGAQRGCESVLVGLLRPTGQTELHCDYQLVAACAGCAEASMAPALAVTANEHNTTRSEESRFNHGLIGGEDEYEDKRLANMRQSMVNSYSKKETERFNIQTIL